MSKTLREQYFELFAENCVKSVELTRVKNLGYTAGTNDPFSNFRFAAQMASIPGKDPVTVEQTILSRMADKISRFKSLVSRGSNGTLDESLVDTLNDLFVYANILQVWKQLGEPGPDVTYEDLKATEQLANIEATEVVKTPGNKVAQMFNWLQQNA